MYELLEKDEYAPYYIYYIKLVREGELIDILHQQLEETSALLQGISEEQAHFRYAPGKWSVKEVVGHLADTERIMGYRLLAIARGEKTPLPGYSENDYVEKAAFNQQSMKDLLEDFVISRKSNLHLIKSLTNDNLLNRGVANNYEVTARAQAVIIAGHELHHRNILIERYIGSGVV